MCLGVWDAFLEKEIMCMIEHFAFLSHPSKIETQKNYVVCT